ncbi:MAG: O-antigen ligase family protein [Verrucomicrobiota bacterium]
MSPSEMKQVGWPVRVAELFCLLLLAAAFAVIQTLIGGTRLVFSLPAYALLACIGVIGIFFLRTKKPQPDQLCFAGAAVFFGYVLARALLSPVPYLARADIYSVLGGLLVYFFVACFLTGPKARTALLLFLLAAAMVHVGIGAIQFRDGNNFMLIPFLQRFDYGRRASGFYICPNHLAGLLEVLGVLGLSIVCWSRTPTWAKLLIGYAVGVCYVGLVLTGSRGGYLSALASLFVFAVLSLTILRRSSPSLFWRIGGAAFIAAIAIGFVAIFLVGKSDFLSGRAGNVFDKTNMRVDLWQAALQQWKLQPLLGTGSGTYLFYGREFRTDRMQLDPVHVHNDYLHLLAEYGALGALTFAVFLFVHLRRGAKAFVRLGPRRVTMAPRLTSNGMALNVGALAAVCAYLVHSAVDFNLHIPANVLLLAFVFGVLANPGMERDQERRIPISQLLWRLSLPALGLVLAFQSVRLFPAEYFAEHARTALRDDHSSRAILYALRALQRDPANLDLYYYLGSARELRGDAMANPRARASFYEAALGAFQNGHVRAPRDETFLLELGFALDALERFGEAEWYFNQALALDPKSVATKAYYQAHLDYWRTGHPLGEPEPAPSTAPVPANGESDRDSAPKKEF